MSNKNNNNLFVAGGVALGIGALVGLGVAAYQTYQIIKEEHQGKQQSICWNSSSDTCKTCYMCNDDKQNIGESLTLRCEHKVHIQCVVANLFLHDTKKRGQEVYTCRFPGCGRPLTDMELRKVRESTRNNSVRLN